MQYKTILATLMLTALICDGTTHAQRRRKAVKSPYDAATGQKQMQGAQSTGRQNKAPHTNRSNGFLDSTINGVSGKRGPSRAGRR